ncbi:MAG: hypothetical protein JWL71_4906 [Acidobacteria bacterium]|nr:hypothetical protein [Acidobacteriota bacterium]
MKRILLAVLGVALVSAGCADPIAPAAPTVALPTIAETFSDTLLVAGTNTHIFNVTTVGAVKVTLNSVVPGASVGLGVGTPSLGSCIVIDHVVSVADQAALLSGTATVPGQYCVIIQDIGNLVEPAVYTINVLHS